MTGFAPSLFLQSTHRRVPRLITVDLLLPHARHLPRHG